MPSGNMPNRYPAMSGRYAWIQPRPPEYMPQMNGWQSKPCRQELRIHSHLQTDGDIATTGMMDKIRIQIANIVWLFNNF